MKIVDEAGIEIAEPDLKRGYLVDDEQIVVHPAEPAIPARYERVLESGEGDNRLYKSICIQPYVPAKPEWQEVVRFKRYVTYTAEELAARAEQAARDEQARLEAEAAAAAEAAHKAAVNALPDAVDELAALTADNTMSIEAICGAIEELAVEVSDMKGAE